jgi:hypothetical protein
MERKILRRFRQFDFVNVDGFPAVPRQNFLGFGFFLRGADSYPDQQTLRLRKLLQSPCALPLQQPTHPEHRSDAYNKPDQNREDADGEGAYVPCDKIKRHGDRADATGDAADDSLRGKHIVVAGKRLPGSNREIGQVCGRN